MNKTAITIILIMCLAFLLAACASKENAVEDTTKATASDDKKATIDSSPEDLEEIQKLKSASDLCAEEPTRCNDDSGLLALTLEANPDLMCDGARHSGWKQICMAVINKDLKRCDRFTDADTEHYVPEHYKAWCRMRVIAVLGKPELCDSTDLIIPGETKESSTSECYLTYAILRNDVSVCAKSDSKEYCERVYAAENEKDVSTCEHLGDICYLDYAYKYNDKEICKKASAPFQLACEVQLTGDSQACRQIKDLDQWYFCDVRSRYKQLMPGPGMFNLAPCGEINQCYTIVMDKMAGYYAAK